MFHVDEPIPTVFCAQPPASSQEAAPGAETARPVAGIHATTVSATTAREIPTNVTGLRPIAASLVADRLESP
jgi:hypothetical protein